MNIFEEEQLTWRGYKLGYCDLCRVITISCEKCSGTNCNCMCCDSCRQDQEDFKKLIPYPEMHLSEEENRAVEKYFYLRYFIQRCLGENQSGLDWEWLSYKGYLSEHVIELFDVKCAGFEYLDYQI